MFLDNSKKDRLDGRVWRCKSCTTCRSIRKNTFLDGVKLTLCLVLQLIVDEVEPVVEVEPVDEVEHVDEVNPVDEVESVVEVEHVDEVESWENKVTLMIFNMKKHNKPQFIKFESSLTTSQRNFLHELTENNDLFHETTGTRYKRLTIYLKDGLPDNILKRLNLVNGSLRTEQTLHVSFRNAASIEIQQHENVKSVLDPTNQNDLPNRSRGRPKKNAQTQLDTISTSKSYCLRNKTN